MGFPSGSAVKNPTVIREHKRHGFDPWVGKIPGEGNGNPLQSSCLENSMDRGAWRAIVHGVAKSWAQLSSPSLKHTYNRDLKMNLNIHLIFKNIYYVTASGVKSEWDTLISKKVYMCFCKFFIFSLFFHAHSMVIWPIVTNCTTSTGFQQQGLVSAG